MKKCLVITKWSLNGEYIHRVLGEKFVSYELRVVELEDRMLGYYHCSKTAARKELVGLKHHDLISIEDYKS